MSSVQPLVCGFLLKFYCRSLFPSNARCILYLVLFQSGPVVTISSCFSLTAHSALETFLYDRIILIKFYDHKVFGCN